MQSWLNQRRFNAAHAGLVPPESKGAEAQYIWQYITVTNNTEAENSDPRMLNACVVINLAVGAVHLSPKSRCVWGRDSARGSDLERYVLQNTFGHAKKMAFRLNSPLQRAEPVCSHPPTMQKRFPLQPSLPNPTSPSCLCPPPPPAHPSPLSIVFPFSPLSIVFPFRYPGCGQPYRRSFSLVKAIKGTLVA